MSEGKAPASPAKPASSSGLVIRIVVWGAVAVIVVLVVWELLARNKANASFEAFKEEFNKRDGDVKLAQLRSDDVMGLLKGSPTRSKIKWIAPGKGYRGNSTRMQTFSWGGILKRYVLIVFYDSPEANPFATEFDFNPESIPETQDEPPDKPKQPVFKIPRAKTKTPEKAEKTSKT